MLENRQITAATQLQRSCNTAGVHAQVCADGCWRIGDQLIWYVLCGVLVAERSEDKKQVQRQQLENWANQQKQLSQVLILLA